MVPPNEKLSKIPLRVHVGKYSVFNYMNREANSVFHSTAYYTTTLRKEERFHFLWLRHIVDKSVLFYLGVDYSTYLYQSAFLAFIFTVILHMVANI